MRLLTIVLNIPLHPGDLPAFRACIAELAGFDNTLFHNHTPEAPATDRSWAYPLVQYAVRRGKAAIIGIGDGATAIRSKLLPQLEGTLNFAGKSYPLGAYDIQLEDYQPEVLPFSQPFSLFGWLALKGDSYRNWKQAATEEERQTILSRALTGQLRALAETLGVPDHKSIVAQVTSVANCKKISWHGADLIRFDVEAKANLALPAGINIGRAAAFGFGEVCASAKPPVRRRKRIWQTVEIP